MKVFRAIWDILTGWVLAGLAGWALYMIIREMIFDAVGWYDASDWLWSIGGSIVFIIVGWAGLRLAHYPLVMWSTNKENRRYKIETKKLYEIIEDGLAQVAALEEGVYQANRLFTPEQADQYYANLKEVE